MKFDFIKKIFRKNKKVSTILLKHQSPALYKRDINNKSIVNIERQKTEIEKEILTIIKNSNDYIKSSELICQLSKKINKNISAPYLRHIIAKLRANGNPIIANNRGYLYTNNEHEILKYRLSRISELNKEKSILNEISNCWL